MRKFVCFSVFIFLIQPGYSQAPGYSPPTGVFCSCGPTTGVGEGSVASAIAEKPFVRGILVRIGWNLLEPEENTFNWSLLDTQISRAKSYGKEISLAIGCGPAIPQWVFKAGASSLKITIPVTDTIAVPWDSVFLSKWTRFISNLGNRYKNDTTIVLVYITNSTSNGFEMQINPTTPPLLSIGYTVEKMYYSWKPVIDAFNTAFPNHYLTNDFHPVNNSNVVADSVYHYAKSTIGVRYGASAWWWTQKNTTVYPAQYIIIQKSVLDEAFTGVQMAYNGTNDSASFGHGGMPAALQLAIDQHICYWEVWNQDLLNPKFDSLLNNAACSPKVGYIDNFNNPEGEISIYPNPATDLIYFSSNSEIKIITVYNIIGIEQAVNINMEGHTIDVSNLAEGMYFVHFKNYKENFFVGKIMKY